MNDSMNNHLNNLSRMYGHDVSTRYSYILDRNDLYNAYAESRSDRYRLRKEVKRDRFVLNTEGLQKEIEDTINYCFKDIEKKLSQAVATDVRRIVQNILNSISLNPNGQFTVKESDFSFSGEIGKLLGKAIVKSAEAVYNEITSDKRKSY